jgi:hypothetical protein
MSLKKIRDAIKRWVLAAGKEETPRKKALK